MLNKKIIKEYAWSALLTFLSAFFLAIAPQIGSASFDQAALFGLILAGIRAGVAALINLVATGFRTISSRPIGESL